MSKRPSLLSRVCHKLSEAVRRRRFARAVRHVQGALCVPEGAVLAIVLVRDGAYYIDAFLDYYRRMGVRYFAFIDNGSTDGTLARLASEPDVAVDQAVLPLAQYEDLLRAYPAQRYGQGRWCLYVDMDEQLDFDGREEHGLPGLIRYLEARGDTALMAQMLEMFPDGPLRASETLDYAAALEAFRHYDISTVDRFDYHAPQIPFSALLSNNRVPTDALKFQFGGVRARVFGEACCLTKHPLVFNGPGVLMAPHPHLSSGVQVSDFSAVIRHYKFAGNLASRDAASAGRGDLTHGEDAARLAVLSAQPDVTLHSDAAQMWAGIEPLYRDGFLVRSDSYARFIAEQAK